MYPGKASHRDLASLYQCPYVPIRTWVSGTTPMVKTLSDKSGQKNIPIIFVRTEDL
jgi:hypothetical protein